MIEERAISELINGQVVKMQGRPSLNHNKVCTNLTSIFGNYLKNNTCDLYIYGDDLFLDENNRYVPDLMIVCNPSIVKENGIHGTPNLIIEVLSPRTAKNDRQDKKDNYEKAGVPEYWIIDPNNLIIEVYLLTNEKYRLQSTYHVPRKSELETMTEEEKQELITEFPTFTFPDLIVKLDDVFHKLHNCKLLD